MCAWHSISGILFGGFENEAEVQRFFFFLALNGIGLRLGRDEKDESPPLIRRFPLT